MLPGIICYCHFGFLMIINWQKLVDIVWKLMWNHLSNHAKIEYDAKNNLAPLSDCLSQPASQPAAYLLVDSQLTQCRQCFYELALLWSLIRLFQTCKKFPILCRENKTGKALSPTLLKNIFSLKIYDQKSKASHDSTRNSSSSIKVENCTALENWMILALIQL